MPAARTSPSHNSIATPVLVRGWCPIGTRTKRCDAGRGPDLRVGDLRELPLFRDLSDDQLAQLIEASAVGRIEPGGELFREGEPAAFWWALVDGVIELSRDIGTWSSSVAT